MADGLLPATDTFFSRIFALASSEAPPGKGYRSLGELYWPMAAGSAEDRKSAGIFYTPTRIIDQILSLVWKDLFPARTSSSVCDPAMGTGFFLLRLVERRAASWRLSRVREWAAEHLFGVDIDPAAVFLAKVGLWLTLSDRQAEFIPNPAHFRRGDSLLGPAYEQAGTAHPTAINWTTAFPDAARSGGFDVVLGNPPYEVLTHFGRQPERLRLAKALRDCGFYTDALTGQVNLYRCFIERGIQILRPGGVLSMVVPLSLARDASAQAVRRNLLEQGAAGEWMLYEERERLFAGVTQSVCIFKAVKGAGPVKRVRLAGRGETTTLTLAQLRAIGGESLILPNITRTGMTLWRTLLKRPTARLEDLCYMRVGEVDQTVYRQCMADQDTGCVLARGAHLSAFHLDTDRQPGRDRFLRLEQFLTMKGKEAAACRERAAQWRVVQLGIRNMQSKPRLVAALAPPGIYLGNSLNVYFPKPKVPLGYLAGLFNSRLLDWLFCLTSGNNNINLHEMRRLPVPLVPGADKMNQVAAAYTRCARTAAAGDDVTESRNILDRAVADCYGLGDRWHMWCEAMDGR